jgi:hypothetical protein
VPEGVCRILVAHKLRHTNDCIRRGGNCTQQGGEKRFRQADANLSTVYDCCWTPQRPNSCTSAMRQVFFTIIWQPQAHECIGLSKPMSAGQQSRLPVHPGAGRASSLANAHPMRHTVTITAIVEQPRRLAVVWTIAAAATATRPNFRPSYKITKVLDVLCFEVAVGNQRRACTDSTTFNVKGLTRTSLWVPSVPEKQIVTSQDRAENV